MSSEKPITHALEDYLETIQHFVDEKGFARVRDICEERGVKSGSVSPAMKRLSEMGLINHQQGEFITLTKDGEVLARRTQARHDILVRFFKDFLRVEAAQSEEDACAIEHHLSDASMDRLTRLFEFIQNCPEGKSDFVARFHDCPVLNHGKQNCEHLCGRKVDKEEMQRMQRSLNSLANGEKALVSRIDAEGQLRQKLLNSGILPDTEIEMERNEGEQGVRLLLNRRSVLLSVVEARTVILK